jgi:tRNA A-37 threonylcarbamoyl transferase component Bud32
VLEQFAWQGFRGVRRNDKEHAIQAFLALHHCLEDFAEGRSVSGFEVNGERFFVKRYRAPLRFWHSVGRSKLRRSMLNELHWLQSLEARGFAAPQPWLFMERRTGKQVETFLVMSEIAGIPLALLADHGFERGALRSMEMIAALHAQGVAHGDCNLYNFLVAEDVHVIDFERATELTPKLAEADVQKFLSRIKAEGKAHLLERLSQAYLKVLPLPLFDLDGLLTKMQACEIPPIITRWRRPQFINVVIHAPGA